jgi:amphi-Trp domain-containing protein
MSDVEITYKERLTRQATARYRSELAAVLGDEGEVELEPGAMRIKVYVLEEARCKVEVEIDRDEVEFEVDLAWSTAARVESVPPVKHPDTDTAGEPPTDDGLPGRRKVGAR